MQQRFSDRSVNTVALTFELDEKLTTILLLPRREKLLV